MRGPRSLFGESTLMPRPISANCMLPPRGCLSSLAYGGSSLLWQDELGLTPTERAARIRCAPEAAFADPEPDYGSDPGHCPALPCDLDVPAPTYIAGRGTSTFALAWKLAEDGLLPEWGSVLCSCQTEGRGRLRRPWHSPRGNLYVTFRLPGDPVLQGDAASLIVGLMLVKGLRSLGFPLSLKWPNDLLLEERSKVGGILLEEKNGILLAGLGLNLAEVPEQNAMRDTSAVRPAVLLPHGSHFSRQDAHNEPLAPFLLWRLLVSGAILEYSRAVSGRDLASLLAELEEHLAWKQRRVCVLEEEDAPIEGLFLGLGPKGGAMLGLPDKTRRECFSGSLSLAS